MQDDTERLIRELRESREVLQLVLNALMRETNRLTDILVRVINVIYGERK